MLMAWEAAVQAFLLCRINLLLFCPLRVHLLDIFMTIQPSGLPTNVTITGSPLRKRF